MAYDFEKNVRSRVDSAEIDLGLKAYMNKVYSLVIISITLPLPSLFTTYLCKG